MKIKHGLLFLLIMLFFDQNGLCQKYDAEVLNYSSLYRVTNNSLSKIDSITILVNNRNGEDYGTFIIPYSKRDLVSNINAWIEGMDGKKIRSLKSDDILDRSDADISMLYSDNFIKGFYLKHNVYPYKVKCTYTITTNEFFHIANWNPVKNYKIPTKNAKIEVSLPKGFKYRTLTNKTESFIADSSSKTINLKWTASYNAPVKEEVYADLNKVIPTVDVIPINFEYGIKGSLQDWKSFGNWIYDLSNELDILPETEIAKILSLVEGISDKKEKIKILYHYLQDNTRYINVSIGVGGLKPHPASYVARNKYGDCKALTNYMKAMLKYVGIESIYTIVYAGDTPRELITEFPSQQFNHVILAVPLENDTIWLENTSKTNPFGYLGTFTQNRQGLMVMKDKSQVITLPSLPADPQTKKLDFEISEDGFAHASIINSYSGANYETYKMINTSLNQIDKDHVIKEIMLFENYEVENWNIKSLGRDSARIELHANLKLSKFLQPIGTDYYFSLYPSGIPLFTKPSARTYPVKITFPINFDNTLSYKLPSGYLLKSEVAPVIIKSDFGTYELIVEQNEGRVYARKKFELFPGSCSLENYPEFYQFIEEVKKADKTKIVIRKV